MGFWTRILGIHADWDGPRSHVAGPPTVSAEDQVFRDKVVSVLEEVRPALVADGGDIVMVEVAGRSAKVRLVGACNACPSAALTLRFGIEQRLRAAIPDFEDLIPLS